MSSSTASPTLSAAHLLAPITSDMEQVNRVIRQSLASDVLLINQIAEYIIGASLNSGATVFLVVLAVPGAGLVVYYYMHIAQLWRPEE